jgi:hypothetical protein
MFTIGIFSTHLPYIAFVFFYAFFFLINFQQNPEGELNKKGFKTDSCIVYKAAQNCYPDYEKLKKQSDFADFLNSYYQKFSQDNERDIFHCWNEPVIKCNYFSANFCRPPPFI